MSKSDYLAALEAGTLYAFSDWPNPAVPPLPGAYTVWDGSQLVYAGMAGRDMPRGGTGLVSRLRSHASGRRSGDQFCVYVADRLVLPTLTQAQIGDIAQGELLFDKLIREWIHGRFSYRFVATPDAGTARLVEREVRSGALTSGPPLLNPLVRR